MALTPEKIKAMEEATGMKYNGPSSSADPNQTASRSRADEIRAMAASSPKASFLDTLTGKIAQPKSATSFQGAEVAQPIVTQPGEVTKGVVKGVPGQAAQVTKFLDETGKSIMGAAGLDTTGTGLDYTDVEELTAPSNEAQGVGYTGAGFLPVERAMTAAKPVAEGVSKVVAPLVVERAMTAAKPVAEGVSKVVAPLVKAGEEYLAKRAAAKTEDFIKDLITPELTPTKTVQAIKTGKVKEGGILSDRDITEAVPFFEETAKAVAEVPGISKSNTFLQNANAVYSHIGTVAEDLKSQIKGKGFFSPNEFNGYMKDASDKLNEIPSLTREATEVANKYLTQFNKLVKKNGYTPEGLLQARKEFDNLLPDKKLSPDIENGITEAVRYIRQGANDFLASRVPDVAVKEMLAKQTALYNAMDNIAPKAAKEGKNKVVRWLKAHPKTVGLMGAAASAVGGGTIVGSIMK